MSFVTLNNIEKTYNPDTPAAVHALQGLSMNIERGEMATIIGASGSGKSTLLHILACLDTGFEGEYILDGMNIKSLNSAGLAKLRNQKIGIVLQNFGLIYDMSVYDNIMLPLTLSGSRYDSAKFEKRVRELLEELGLSEKSKTRAGRLSGGQKQRVAIARALINDPPLLLADEPTGALDRDTSSDIMDVFKELNIKGKTILVVTHDMNVASRCHRVLELTDGVFAIK